MKGVLNFGPLRATQTTTAGTSSLASWLLQAAQLLFRRGGVARGRSAARQMKLVETLALGGRKHLLLVVCGGESFLVGTGAESVQTIVHVRRDESASGFANGFEGDGQ